MNTFVRSNILASFAFATLASTSAANADTTPIDTARRAISMGYGGECSLEMLPVERGGYYPCIDIAPYRIVFLYGGVRVFVTQKDRAPFPIMEGPQDSPEFTINGPWTADLPARVALWWRDTVEGGARKAADQLQESENKKAAEEYVNKLMGKTEEKQQPPSQETAALPESGANDSLEIDEDIRRILTH